MIALTFDDGPSKFTPQILDLLERHNARATFFTVGNLLHSRRDIVTRAVSLGCEVSGHSWDHQDLTTLSADEVKKQILDTAAAIHTITGVKTAMFRPPYGSVDEQLRNVSAEIGFAIVNWSIDTLDWHIRDADAVYNVIMREVGDRAIILCHDLYASTVEAMERVIPELLSQGYQLVTVSELLSYAHDSLEAGRLYKNGR
jgi:peptidoglycan/xylan/chitin deacetylase (PgdA/CDA1 family)